MILKTQNMQEEWFNELSDNWRLDVSFNSWTTDKIGLQWLIKLFISTVSVWRKDTHFLLILNSCESHLTPEFNWLCIKNNIVPLCMLSHSSHLLQSLNVSVFAMLKCLYKDLIKQQMCLDFNTIQKADFLNVYSIAKKKVFTSQNI